MDPEFAALAAEALRLRQRREPPLVVLTRDASFGPPTAALDAIDYEDFLASGDPTAPWEIGRASCRERV